MATTKNTAHKTTARKAAAPKAPGALTAKAEAKLLADITSVDSEIRRLTALRDQRAALLLKARAANISYTRLAEAMGGIPTGNVHAIVKAAAGKAEG